MAIVELKAAKKKPEGKRNTRYREIRERPDKVQSLTVQARSPEESMERASPPLADSKDANELQSLMEGLDFAKPSHKSPQRATKVLRKMARGRGQSLAKDTEDGDALA